MSSAAAAVLFVLSLIGVFGASHGVRRTDMSAHPLLRPWWFPALVTAEAVPVRITIHAALVALLAALGALDHALGRAGLALTAITWITYAVIQWRARAARRAVASALEAVGIDAEGFAHIDWWRVLAAYPFRVPRSVERIEDVEYIPGLHLDVYRRRQDDTTSRPAILQIHGGGWRGGNRRQQARPMLHRLAEQGWVCVSASYPLVPEATFPEPLIALKSAIAWMRSPSGRALGIDPDRIAVTGGSAGGHLAALLALTANEARYQPGFEGVDTSVMAAVPMYGVYDFFNRNRTREDWPVIPRGLMKASRAEAPERYRDASPLDQVHKDAPPFFVIHGENDSLISTQEAEHFVAALRNVSASLVAYAEVPGANHAFDALDSLRTHYVISAVARFLEATVASAPTDLRPGGADAFESDRPRDTG